MDGPRYIPLETSELARALLLVRLRDRCPPPPPPLAPVCAPCRRPDDFEPSGGTIRFSTFLERQNQEFRAAREHDRLCELSDPRPPHPRPERPAAEAAGMARGGEVPAARAGASNDAKAGPAGVQPNNPKHRVTSYQRIPTQTGRLIDVFL